MSEIASVAVYVLSFTLLEIIFVFSGIVLLSVVLPKSILQKKMVAKSTVIIVILMIWIGVVHNLDTIVPRWLIFFSRVMLLFGANSEGHNLFSLGIILFLLIWGLSFAIALVFSYVLINRYKVIGERIVGFLEKVALLAWIYISIDLIALFTVLVRNLI
jgi:hypothetical protein